MSSLTQARLAPLSQRYISMSARRHDLHEKLSSSSHPVIDSPQEKDITNSQWFNSNQNSPSNKYNHSYFGKGLVNHYHPNRHFSVTHDYCGDFRIGFGNELFRLRNSKTCNINRKFTVNTYNIFETPYKRTVSNRQHYKEQQDQRGEQNSARKNYDAQHFVALLGAMSLFKKSTTEDNDELGTQLSDGEKMKKMKPIEIEIAKGVLAMCDQDYSKANQLFHNALHMAQEDNDEERESLVLNLIASNYFESGDFENAEKLFIEIIKRMVAKDFLPTSPAILELSLKLASIYGRNSTTHDKALSGFKFVINSLLDALNDVLDNLDELDSKELSDEKKNELAMLGWSYDWFGKFLIAANDYKGAADMLQQALKISLKVLGPSHDQTLILFNDIGTTLAMDNSLESGRTFIKKAVEGAISSQSNELASFYVNLGIVNLKLKKLQDAKMYCEYSIELASKNREHHNSHEVMELSRSCLNEVEHLLAAEQRQ